MDSPKSRSKPHKRKQGPRRHTNKQFYNSKEWKQSREAYLREYQSKIYNEVTRGYWTVSGTRLELSLHQQTYILSLPALPCELCLKLYSVEAYDTIEMGKELDHIQPINTDNALISDGYGDPLNPDNYQFLCPRHHAKKSQREKNKS